MSSLSSVFSTAITGLDASQTTINVTGNNTANADTVGFKASNSLGCLPHSFAMTHAVRTQGVAGGVGGGTEPTQIGLGVEVAHHPDRFYARSIQNTSNPYNIWRSRGMDSSALSNLSAWQQREQAEQTNAQIYYTRNGQFQLNASNQLTTSSGQLLLGYPVNSNSSCKTPAQPHRLRFRLGQPTVAKATSEVTMQGVLPPSGSVATTAQIQDSAVTSATVPGRHRRGNRSGGSSRYSTVTAPTTSFDPSVPAGSGVSSSTTYSYGL